MLLSGCVDELRESAFDQSVLSIRAGPPSPTVIVAQCCLFLSGVWLEQCRQVVHGEGRRETRVESAKLGRYWVKRRLSGRQVSGSSSASTI